eukprot:tig00000405_g444.t1
MDKTINHFLSIRYSASTYYSADDNLSPYSPGYSTWNSERGYWTLNSRRPKNVDREVLKRKVVVFQAASLTCSAYTAAGATTVPNNILQGETASATPMRFATCIGCFFQCRLLPAAGKVSLEASDFNWVATGATLVESVTDYWTVASAITQGVRATFKVTGASISVQPRHAIGSALVLTARTATGQAHTYDCPSSVTVSSVKRCRVARTGTVQITISRTGTTPTVISNTVLGTSPNSQGSMVPNCFWYWGPDGDSDCKVWPVDGTVVRTSSSGQYRVNVTGLRTNSGYEPVLNHIPGSDLTDTSMWWLSESPIAASVPFDVLALTGGLSCTRTRVVYSSTIACEASINPGSPNLLSSDLTLRSTVAGQLTLSGSITGHSADHPALSRVSVVDAFTANAVGPVTITVIRANFTCTYGM